MMLDMRPRCDRRRPNPSLPTLHPSGTQRTQLDMTEHRQPRADQPDLRAAQVVSSGSGSTTGTAPFHKACGGRWRGVASLGCERGAAGQYQDGP